MDRQNGHVRTTTEVFLGHQVIHSESKKVLESYSSSNFQNDDSLQIPQGYKDINDEVWGFQDNAGIFLNDRFGDQNHSFDQILNSESASPNSELAPTKFLKSLDQGSSESNKQIKQPLSNESQRKNPNKQKKTKDNFYMIIWPHVFRYIKKNCQENIQEIMKQLKKQHSFSRFGSSKSFKVIFCQQRFQSPLKKMFKDKYLLRELQIAKLKFHFLDYSEMIDLLQEDFLEKREPKMLKSRFKNTSSFFCGRS